MSSAELTKTNGLPPVVRFFFVVGIAGLFFLRFGYQFGSSDQDEFLPYLLHLLRPDLLQTDWFVQSQITDFSVRSALVYLLFPFGKLFSIGLSVLIIYVASLYLIVSSVLDLVYRLTKDELASLVSTILILVLTPYWQPGGNEILNRMLVPSMLAWGLSLKGTVLFVENKYYISIIIVSVATWIQPLVGLQFAGVLLLSAFLLRFLDSHRRGSEFWVIVISAVRTLRRPALLFVLLVVPLFWMLVSQQNAPVDLSESAFVVLTRIRAPHHYVPSHFPVGSWIRFSVIVILGSFSFLLLRKEILPDRKMLIITVGAVLSVLLLVALAGSSVVTIPIIVKLQLFKLTLPAKALSLVLIVHALFSYLPDRLLARADRFITSRPAAVLTVFLSVLVLTASFSWPPLTGRTLPDSSSENQSRQSMMKWVRTNTPVESVFAVPPGFSGFRFGAWRAIYVNFKAVPFSPRGLIEWNRRIREEAPIIARDVGGTSYLERADESYHSRTPASVAAFVKSSDIGYVLRRGPFSQAGADSVLRPVYSSQDWWIYEIQNSNEVTVEPS